jgi:dihydrofolate reductase
MRIVNSTYMSLDGVIQRPELWTFDYRSDDVAKVTQEQLFGADALIMGRHTYDMFAPRWSTASDEAGLAERINSIPNYCCRTACTSRPGTTRRCSPAMTSSTGSAT